MEAQVLDGKACGAIIESELASRIANLKHKGIIPHLAVIIVGDDPASHVYVNNKIRACERLGIKSTHIELILNIEQSELVEVIASLNNDDD